MRFALLAASVLFASTTLAQEAVRPADAQAEPNVVIADSRLVFRANEDSGVRMLSDIDREVAETIMRINRTRGTWQSYLLYTTPEMKVPASQPGFTFTLPPPSRAELERRRRAQSDAEKREAARAPQPAEAPPATR